MHLCNYPYICLTLRRLREEDPESEANLGYIVRPCPKEEEERKAVHRLPN